MQPQVLIDTLSEAILKALAKRYLKVLQQKDPTTNATLMSVQEDLARAAGHKDMHAAQAYWDKQAPTAQTVPVLAATGEPADQAASEQHDGDFVFMTQEAAGALPAPTPFENTLLGATAGFGQPREGKTTGPMSVQGWEGMGKTGYPAPTSDTERALDENLIDLIGQGYPYLLMAFDQETGQINDSQTLDALFGTVVERLAKSESDEAFCRRCYRMLDAYRSPGSPVLEISKDPELSPKIGYFICMALLRAFKKNPGLGRDRIEMVEGIFAATAVSETLDDRVIAARQETPKCEMDWTDYHGSAAQHFVAGRKLPARKPR